MELINNIDIVQINVKQGIDEYYFPKNVNWRDRKIDKVLLALSDRELLSPIDGITPVFMRSQISNLYFDFFAADDHQIARNLYYEDILSDNNHPVMLGEVLSLNLSRLYFTKAPETNGCLLLYIFYGSKMVEDSLSTQSITVSVDLPANGKMSLQEIVDNYIHIQPKRVKGIIVWNQSEPSYLTLRNQSNDRVFNNVLSLLFRPPVAENSDDYPQAFPARVDDIDIDMLNSYVQNATKWEARQMITFNY